MGRYVRTGGVLVVRPFYPTVNQHVTYFATTTRKPRPATVTATTGGGSTTLSAQGTAGATTVQTAASVAIGRRIIFDSTSPSGAEERIVSNVSGAGPFTLTIPALSYTHLNGATVLVVPSSITVRVGHFGETHAGVTRAAVAAPKGTNVWEPA